jgi:hypothetical protein
MPTAYLKNFLAGAASTNSWERRYYVNGLYSIKIRYTTAFQVRPNINYNSPIRYQQYPIEKIL